jgi:MFS transporter, PAT family, beta-lactamase induction signal transducer AmpG
MSSSPPIRAGEGSGRDAARGARRGRLRHPWLEAAQVYREPRVLGMLFLGFSSGLPFYLYFQTLSAWLRQSHVALATIGLLSLAGMFYSLKFVWAPLVDRWQLPGLHRWLGRRRSWMLLAQVGIGLSLLYLSASEPASQFAYVVLGSACLTFFAATQDIAMDAWRIESAPDEMQGAMAASYNLGYRVALIIGSAGALGLAAGLGWHASYRVMAALVLVGMVTTLLVHEPQPRAAGRSSAPREARAVEWFERKAHWPAPLRHAGATVIAAVVCPLVDFFERQGVTSAILVLLLIATYHFTDYAMGSMINPFYIDHGYTLAQIATIVKIVGLSVGLFGTLLAGLLIARYGIFVGLVLGSVLILCSNLGFALLAHTAGPTAIGLGLANTLDNLALAMQGMALIAFLSSLTSPKYTATQYALFSSLYPLTGKTLEGTSGFVAHAIGYVHFFVYTASLSIPPLLLLYWLSRRHDFKAGTLASA